MPEKSILVSSYLKELRRTRKEKPDQIRESLEIYIQLWERVIKSGLVRPDENVGEALRKIDANGGLYKAAEE